MKNDMIAIFEDFLSSSNRSSATNKLINYGMDAVPILIMALKGEIMNLHGQPYRNVGALDCILVCCYLLKKKYGKMPLELDNLIECEIDNGHEYARQYKKL